MKKDLKIFLLTFVFLHYTSIHSQDNSWMVYDDSEVAEIRISMEQSDLDWMYENPLSDSMHLAKVHFKNAIINEIVDSVGIRIRGNTSRVSHKKSLKLSFNTFIQGGDFYSLEKLNLNGEHNDPSIVRSKLCWDFFNRIGVVSSRSAHAAVFINDKYYGLYISVEHIDEKFLQKNYLDDSGNLWKCLFGSDLTYLGNNADLYKFENSEGNRPYELIRNEELDDYSNLARLIDIINNTPQTDFEDSLESIIDVISILKYFAANILVGGWDDYWSLSNNFYLYHNPALDEFSLIPYDYDNTFGITWWDIDWSGVNPYTFSQIYPGPRPLVNRIMQTPKYRNLFTHFLEFYSENYFNTDFFYNGLENLKTKIQTYAENDTFRLADWGFTTEHFLRSFSEPDFYYENDIIVPESIRDFVLNRTISLKSQLNYINFAPIIYDFSLSQTHLLSDQNLEIRSSIFSNQGIDSVKVEVSIKDEGTYFKEMNYIPQNASFYVEENDLWTVELPPFGESKQAFIRIIAKDKLGNISSYPENGIQIYTASPVSNEILINELMSNNVNTYSDEAGEYDDWIELFNPTDAQIDLSEKYLTDKKDNLTKWKIPQGMIINANEYLIFWCDEDQEQGNNHTNFRLSSEGEFIALVDTDGISIIDSLTFPAISQDNSYARNDGRWKITSSATPGANNIITSVTDKIAADFQINIAAFPNPFNPGTTISYELPKKLDVKLGIFDMLGREVWNIELKNQEAGSYEIDWNGADVSGKKLSSGIYFARIFGRSFSETVKLIILR